MKGNDKVTSVKKIDVFAEKTGALKTNDIETREGIRAYRIALLCITVIAIYVLCGTFWFFFKEGTVMLSSKEYFKLIILPFSMGILAVPILQYLYILHLFRDTRNTFSK